MDIDKRAAQFAMEIQDACNPVAILKHGSKIFADMLHEKGTDYVAKHPAMTLMLDKLATLNNVAFDYGAFDRAYTKVKEMVDEEEPAASEELHPLDVAEHSQDPYYVSYYNDGCHMYWSEEAGTNVAVINDAGVLDWHDAPPERYLLDNVECRSMTGEEEKKCDGIMRYVR